jgi:hypothetical protein
LDAQDTKETIGHGVRGKRSKAGAVSFDVFEPEDANPPLE